MTQYIDKSAVVAEIKILMRTTFTNFDEGVNAAAKTLLESIDTLEVKEVDLNSIAYVITRCEEHSDYVEEVFFDKDKAQEYCDQFKENEDEYARHITKVKVTL